MDILLSLATLAVVQLMAVISPGQSFVFVARTAVAAGRAPALAATLGMAFGSCVWAVAAMLGMAVVLEQAAWAYALLKLAGGLYLLYLGMMLWLHASDAIEVGEGGVRPRLLAALRQGFLIQIANPKVVVFFGSIFFALLPAGAPPWAMAAAVLIVFVNEAAWFATVSVLLSASRPRGAFLRFKTTLDRAMAGALGLLGAKLIADAR